jgi:rSAM/selenodomain-associated transferase 2/rSAM/selenodomain-associated transferase 1
VSGTVKGVIGAGTKILSTIFRAAMGSLPGDEGQEPRERLIVFTRYPESGTTKTRLIRTLGAGGAAELHRRMSQNAVARAKEALKHRPLAIEIRFDGGNKRLMKGWLGRGVELSKQTGDDLGERMYNCFVEAFENGFERAVLAGTDCPAISADIFDRAFQALDRSDVVLGPASDGGYYLVGMKRAIPQLFAGITWGASDVLQQTTRVADKLGLQVGLIDLLNDVDRADDLHVWERESGRTAADVTSPRISAIIPTYNEADFVREAISSVQAEDGVEIIVVDGGSGDATVENAEAAGARTIVSSDGRGSQMNAGAAEATGDILLFLHADTVLPEDYARHVRAAMVHAGTVAGAFGLGIDSPERLLRHIEWLANWRSKHMHLPYGDQAIFMRREVFEEMGGFPEIPIMEDFELMRRLKRRGRIAIVAASVQTSARRWLDVGVLRTTLVHQAVIAAYFLGVPISRIANWYHSGIAATKL